MVPNSKPPSTAPTIYYDVTTNRNGTQFLDVFFLTLKQFSRDQQFRDVIELYLDKDIEIFFTNQLTRWAKIKFIAEWPLNWNWRSNGMNTNLSKHLPLLIDYCTHNRVLIIEAPTGSGKSIVAPEIAFKAAQRIVHHPNYEGNRDVRFKGVHLMPTGEQVMQTTEYVHEYYLSKAGIHISGHCSARNKVGKSKYPFDLCKTDYIMATPYFGMNIISTNGCNLHVVIVDEIHELTPQLIKLLREIRLRMQEGNILRLILLTATLSNEVKDLIDKYFTEMNPIWVKAGTSPHNRTITNLCQDEISMKSVLNVDKSTTLQRLIHGEEDSMKGPKMSRLIERAVGIADQLCIKLASAGANNLPQNPGMIIFLPGSSEVVTAVGMFRRYLKNMKYGSFTGIISLYGVTGKDRSDMKVLRNETRLRVNILFSTPLLATGVTLIRTQYVIDTGTQKLPSPRNRQSVSSLMLLWQDFQLKAQKEGRIGRISDGIVYQAFSKFREVQLNALDHTMKRVDAMYTSSDLHYILTCKEANALLHRPNNDLMNSLLLQTATQGYLKPSSRPIRNEEFNPQIDAIATGLSKALPMLELDQSHFLAYCCAYGCLLPGIILVASMLSNHSGTKKPTGDQQGLGRDSSNLAISQWTKITGIFHFSDMIAYTELLLNIMLDGPANERADHPLLVTLPQCIQSQINNDTLDDIFTSMRTIIHGLELLGLSNSTRVYTLRRSGIVQMVLPDEKMILYSMDEHRNDLFNVAIISAFGHNVIEIAPKRNQNRYKHLEFCMQTNPNGDNRMKMKVLGERPCPEGMNKNDLYEKYPADTLAVYQSLFHYSPKEEFYMGLIHQCRPIDILLHANVGSAFIDEISTSTYIMRTNSGPICFKLDQSMMSHRNGIALLRKYQKMIPAALFMDCTKYVNEVINMIINSKLYITDQTRITRQHKEGKDHEIIWSDDYKDYVKFQIDE